MYRLCASALAALPDTSIGDVLGSCKFNLLILPRMDAVQPETDRALAHAGPFGRGRFGMANVLGSNLFDLLILARD